MSLNALEIDEVEKNEGSGVDSFAPLPLSGFWGKRPQSGVDGRAPSQALAPSTEHARDGMGLQLLRLILLLTALALCAHCSGGEGVPSEAGWLVGMPCDEAPVGGYTSDRSQPRIK